MRKFTLGAIATTAVLLAGCGGQSGQSNGPSGGGTAATIANPTDFALAADAKILDAKPFNQTVTVKENGGSALAQGSGTYNGHTVIAQSTGSVADVKAWLAKEEGSPPAGYAYMSGSANPRAVATAAKYGVTFAVFKGDKKGAIVAVIDSKLAHEKLGFLLDLVDKYRMVPESMRGQIDQEVKKRAGMSVTEALDPSAPIGMTVEALKAVNGSDNPAIVIIDAAKQ